MKNFFWKFWNVLESFGKFFKTTLGKQFIETHSAERQIQFSTETTVALKSLPKADVCPGSAL